MSIDLEEYMVASMSRNLIYLRTVRSSSLKDWGLVSKARTEENRECNDNQFTKRERDGEERERERYPQELATIYREVCHIEVI
jgi:hypothetical protein